MTHDEMIAVIQAHKNGKRIQYQDIYGSNHAWRDVIDEPCWSFAANNYRVKPEPREWWNCEYPGGDVKRFVAKRDAEEWKEKSCARDVMKIIHVREVID